MNLSDAVYNTVHDYPGGTESLAPRIGMSGAILRNKANPNNPANKLTLEDADKIIGVTGDTRILNAMCANHGGMFVPLDASGCVCDSAILEIVTHVWRSNGDVGRAVDDVLADGRVERHEIIQVRDAAYALQQQVAMLINRLEGMAE